jgi:large subunit ribosomal protein L35
MPKIKTKRSAAKRFSFTKNGKIRRNKAFSSHIRTKKSPERKRKFRKTGYVHDNDAKNVKQMLPYG